MASQSSGLSTYTNSSLITALGIFLASFMASSLIAQNSIASGPVLSKGTGGTTIEFIPYNGSKYGMTIQYPKNWDIKEDPSGVWFVSPIDRTGNIRISSQPAIGNASLSELVQAQLLQLMNSYNSFKINSSEMTTMAGITANRTDFQIKDEVPRFLGKDIYEYGVIKISAINDNRLYTFTYFSTPQNFHLFMPVVEKMLGTLKII